MFKLQSPSKYSPLDAIHLSRCFSHCSKQFLNSLILMPFRASAVFCFTASTRADCFSLRNFFIWRNKKSCWGEIGWIRTVGHVGHVGCFGQKLLNTRHGVGSCACHSLIVKWANVLKESSKKIHRTKLLATPPPGTRIQMGSWNAHLSGKPALLGARCPEDNSGFFWGGIPLVVREGIW